MIAPLLERLLRARRLVPVVVALLVARVAYTSWLFTQPGTNGGRINPTDFHAFFVAGRLALEGAIAQAYDLDLFLAAQQRLIGSAEFLPWTYPLHANLVTALLATMPIWLGNLVLGLASIALFMAGMARLAGPNLPLVLVAVLPALMTCLRSGQNGVAMAGLMALLAHGALAGRWQAGVPLALLTMKPHFLPGVGLWLLGRRAFAIILVGALGALALVAVASWLFTPAAWTAFLGGVGEASAYLRDGRYPLHRMTTIYATLFRAGVAPGLALALHGAVAAGWLGLLLWSAAARWPTAQQLAVALFFTLFLTPYGYDYDAGLAGVALALLAGEARARGSVNQLVLLCLLLWVAGLSGVAMTDAYADAADIHARLAQMPSLGGPALQAMALLLLWIVRRQPERPLA